MIYGKCVTWKSRGYFFHENPSNPIGDTQKYQKKLNFWSKTCFLWVFLELLQCYCYKLRKYTNFIFSPIQLIFVQFSLERTHLKGKDKWFLVPKVPEVSGQKKKNYGLKNLELEGQISQNGSPQIFFFRKQKKPKKSSTFRWCSENFIFFCFWYSKLSKTVFFPEFSTKKYSNWAQIKK